MNLRAMRDTVTITALALAGFAAGYVAIGIVGHGGAARAASFDCARAASPSELAICGNATLSALDSQLGAAYALRIAAAPALRDTERAWLQVRNVGCGKDVACLTRMTRAQVAWLSSGASMPATLPRAPGKCSLSRIQQVGTRLGDGTQPVGDDPGSGSAVIEANKAMQVFYDQIPDIDHSRAGDAALVCLIDLPHDCPPGDDRGKVYGVANLRTRGAWSGPDAEHLCGGA
jgi:uncharacterized protein